jgi:hypothetical protein
MEMYFFESNFFPVLSPDIYRINPNTGRSNQGRSCFPTIAHAIPEYPFVSRPSISYLSFNSTAHANAYSGVGAHSRIFFPQYIRT